MINAEIKIGNVYYTRVSGALVKVKVTGETTRNNRRLWTIERVIGLGAPENVKAAPKLEPRNASALHETRNPTEEIRRRREVSKTEVPVYCTCEVPTPNVDPAGTCLCGGILRAARRL